MTTVDPSAPSVNPETALADIALRSDAHATVLARHRLDFCCGGRKTLSQACVAAGLDVQAVLTELDVELSARAAATAGTDWKERPLDELADFIVQTHHEFTRTAIARITPLLAKVLAKHGDRHPELPRIATVFAALAAEMEPHMLREERVLFPYIRALSRSPVLPPAPPFGTVRNPVRMMMSEHDRAAEHLAELDEATGGFSAPTDACNSFRAVYAALAELRLDLMKHVSLENNVLFPRAIAIEGGRPTTPMAPLIPR